MSTPAEGGTVHVSAYPAGPDLFWIECNLCGPVTMVDQAHCTPACVSHLNEHGCAIETG